MINGSSRIVSETSCTQNLGAKHEEGKVKTNGGRVIAITSMGATVKEALDKSYNSIKNISFEKMNYRGDIGFDL